MIDVATTTRQTLPTREDVTAAQQEAMDALGANVKERRKARGINQDVLAKAVGRTPAWLCQLEKGLIEDTPVSMLVALATVLKCSPQLLLRSSSEE